VVAIDPAVTSGEDADETGMVVVGKDANGHGYVLADQSGRYTPIDWARNAISLYRQHKADRIVAETNNGGDLVESNIRVVMPMSHSPQCTRRAAKWFELSLYRPFTNKNEFIMSVRSRRSKIKCALHD
jgi:phage terminase large subunit-like protein